MKRIFVVVLFVLAALPASLLAKGETIKITISGPHLSQPIEITDPHILRNFGVWTGPGTSSNESQGLIVDWARGAVSKHPSGLLRYQVSFYARLSTDRLAYVAFYELDPATGEGFVYLPGQKDPDYRLNVSTILHGVEGEWFHAWTVWENVAKPLIAKAAQPTLSSTEPSRAKS